MVHYINLHRKIITFVLIVTALIHSSQQYNYYNYYDYDNDEEYFPAKPIVDDDHLKNASFSFDCRGRAVGFYADVEYDCQIFHMCNKDGGRVPHICANGTSFNQEYRICDWDFNFNCEDASKWFHLNNKVNVDRIEDNVDKVSEKNREETPRQPKPINVKTTSSEVEKIVAEEDGPEFSIDIK